MAFDVLGGAHRVAVAVRCKVPRDLGLVVSSLGFFAVAPSDRRSRVSSGESEFDARVSVYAKDVAAAEVLLGHAAFRDELRRVVGAHETAMLYDDWVAMRPRESDVADGATARATLAQLVEMADVLNAALPARI